MTKASDVEDAPLAGSFAALWAELAAIGRSPSGATERLPWTTQDREARDWFVTTASVRGMPVETDLNGNLWAWWPKRAAGALATGSHLDTVPGGGAWDGALGVVSAFAAIDLLRSRGVRLARPVAVVAWAEEEGARFGLATLGSRLATGAVEASEVASRTDASGVRFEDAVRDMGLDARTMGPERDRLGELVAFVELHVEQGRALDPMGAAIGLASGIDPHGRWHVAIDGRADHAGTARLADRHDPMLALAALLRSARRVAIAKGGVATVGRVFVRPNGSNVVPGSVEAWLDIRATTEPTVRAILDGVRGAVARAARREGVTATFVEESWTPGVSFDPALRARIDHILRRHGVVAPMLSTAAGHDAGVLAAHVPSAMVFVRNPTGVSHAPGEGATSEDVGTGVRSLAAILQGLGSGPALGYPPEPRQGASL